MLRMEESGRMGLRATLCLEFERRRAKNARYSLRAFARDLRVDHASLSQILRGRRPLGTDLALRLGRRLGFKGAALAAAATSPDTRLSKKILFLVSLPEFRPDSRWIAGTLRASVDDVNVAVAALAREGRLRMDSPTHWRRARARRRLPFAKPNAAPARKGA